MNPFRLGWEAYEKGKSRYENPYRRGTPAYADWVVGWRKAQYEHSKIIL
jgi:ribosome modulation factor